jgi:hypothetical protein
MEVVEVRHPRGRDVGVRRRREDTVRLAQGAVPQAWTVLEYMDWTA